MKRWLLYAALLSMAAVWVVINNHIFREIHGTHAVLAATPPRMAQTSPLTKKNKLVIDGHPPLEDVAAVVLGCNRPEYLNRTLESLVGLDGASQVALYASLDGHDAATTAVANSFKSLEAVLHHPRLRGHHPGTRHLASHYKWVLDELFFERGYARVILLEDDMQFSPDLFAYFAATAPLLERDPSIWCVSSWNDNGFKNLAKDPRVLFRSSHFPGLGWMLRRELWEEFSPKWPQDHWDHWMRLDSTSKGRDCVCPQVSRNFNFGRVGATVGETTYKRYLANTAFNKARHVDLGPLDYLELSNYANLLTAWSDPKSSASLATFIPSWLPEHLRPTPVAMRTQLYPFPSTNLPTNPYVTPSFDKRTLKSLMKKSKGSTTRSEQPLVHVIASSKEAFPAIAAAFGIWHEPRAQHRHTWVIFAHGYIFLIVDVRRSPYAPAEIKVRPPERMTTVVGERGLSCDEVCQSNSARCDPIAFDFINQISQLKAHFSCSDFGFEDGEDNPGMVANPKDDSYGRCHVTPKLPLCPSKSPAISRLCPCVP